MHNVITCESKVQVDVSLGRHWVLTNGTWHVLLQSGNLFELGGITTTFMSLSENIDATLNFQCFKRSSFYSEIFVIYYLKNASSLLDDGEWKVTERDLVVASTRHHRARWLKYYQRPSRGPILVKSRMIRPLPIHFLHSQQIFFVLVCIRAGIPRVPPRVLAPGPKPCRGNQLKGYRR